MAVRILTYIRLLYQDLIKSVPASLAAYRPSLRYFLLDEGRVSEESLNQPDNAVARLVEIERR